MPQALFVTRDDFLLEGLNCLASLMSLCLVLNACIELFLRPMAMTLLSSACDKGLGTEKIYILCEKKCFSLATTLKLKFCGISTFKAMELSTL